MSTIHDAVEYYRNNIDVYWEGEKYKWQAVQWFQDHWDMDAPDFHSMYEQAFSKANNLLNGGRYFPYLTMCRFSEMNPDKVKELFVLLYDETLPLKERIRTFRDSCSGLLTDYVNSPLGSKKTKNHYQDLRALMVYLSCRYPEKYYLYKAAIYNDFLELVPFQASTQSSDYNTRKLESFAELCQAVIDEVMKDPELVTMQEQKVTSTEGCYADPQLHVLAQTIIYVYGNKYAETGNKGKDDGGDSPEDLTKEDWKEFLENVEYPWHKGCMRVLKCFLDIGGEASCKILSEKYKGHPNVYSSSIMNTCRRARNYFEMEPIQLDEETWYFSIAFDWKNGTGDEKGTIIYTMRSELMEALKEMALDDISMMYRNVEDDSSVSDVGLNTILFGPPGTGKTYHTAYYAVAICDNLSIDEVKKWDPTEVRARFDELKEQNRIAFTTFHQSYGYEEFIEGIRPVIQNSPENTNSDSGEVTYEVREGIFKEFCELARNSRVSAPDEDFGLNENPAVWKVSLEGAGDNSTRAECMENGHIRIGWDEYGPDLTREASYQYGGKVILNAFYNKMQIGDIVLSCYSSELTDAIGVITGEPEWDSTFSYYRRVRKVKWLVKGIRENIIKINENKPMVLASVYKMDVKAEDALNIVRKYLHRPSSIEDKQNYVFIIDEINRGNISKIFGELITLIETSKREGGAEETKVKLPYSKTSFSVPKNVYILGTMNTADRSIALMDTALRRRFQFVEMMPDVDVIRDLTINEGEESLNVADMLEIINKRIEFLYDREHTIGHAFFMSLLRKEKPKVADLAEIFKKSVVPLLQEYFYEDYEKIRMVLGDNAKKNTDIEFVREIPADKDLFRGNVTVEDFKDYVYQINDKAFFDIRSYKGISEKL